MRARIARLVAGAYGVVSSPPRPAEPVEVEPGLTFPGYLVEYGEAAPRQAVTFFDRMRPWLDVRDRAVLDVGCGVGAVCLEAARRGARRVLGVDIAPDAIRFAEATLSAQERRLPVELRTYGGDPDELGDERFDVVISKDALTYYGARLSTPDADAMVERMADRLHEGGLLALRAGPLWRAPYGGHIDTWLPWAHLIFPEPVIFERYRRDRHGTKDATTFEEGPGVNRTSLARLRRIMAGSGLECLHFATNAGDSAAVGVMRALARVPGLEEYFTQNAQGVWRRPPGWGRTAG
jgi:2-polyprenyl-3-methyl-5-hydroxy-6-metoxy-1,4-benzoquinol methylase